VTSPPSSWGALNTPNVHLFVLNWIAATGLILAWHRAWVLRHSIRMSKAIALPLLVTTASYGCFLLVLTLPSILTPSFGTRASITIELNIYATLVVFVVSMARKGPLRWPIGVACGALLLIWLIIGALSSAV